ATNYSCVDTTLQVLLCARDFGVKRVVIAASSSAYGDTEVLPKEESMTPRPLSPYAASKLAQEHYCTAFSTCYGVETVALRYFNVFGPRQDPKSDYAAVIPKFIRMILAGNRPTIYGDGEQSRDFTFIDDVVNANLLAARAEGMFLGEVINIARGERITVNELFSKINAVLGTAIEPEYVDPVPGDVRQSLADISRARELIGYEPTTTIEAGLEKTAAWVRENLQGALGEGK
ncbi:MAG: NAD-dependent epimerase/dehydratase family protein, partial [Planctomycetes bacterium]|nr:NAD-dependent epimerase/dehydratase family protein [Planctomycetota bacterium]